MNTTTDWIFTYPDPESPGGHTWVKVPDTYFNKKLNKVLHTSKVFFRNGVVQNFERRTPVLERQLIRQSVVGLADLFKHYTGKTPTTSNYFMLRSLFYQHIYRSFDPDQVINDARDLIGKTIYEDPMQLQLQFKEFNKKKSLVDHYYNEYLMASIHTLETLIQMEHFKDYIEWDKLNGMEKAYAELRRKETL